MKKTKAVELPHSKLRGELAELRFMARAAEEGLTVIKPWGDSNRYDFVVENSGKFLRVQVKSSRMRQGNHFLCGFRRAQQKPYKAGELDFMAVYLVPIQTWYIIPSKVVCGVKAVMCFSPHNSLSKHHQYREAWHLLGATGVADEPVRAKGTSAGR